jgi:hypothetical protein
MRIGCYENQRYMDASVSSVSRWKLALKTRGPAALVAKRTQVLPAS